MDRLAAGKKLVATGPFYSNDRQDRCHFLFDVKTVEEVGEFVKSDPSVTNKHFETEMYL